jgi:hypothetical protein
MYFAWKTQHRHRVLPPPRTLEEIRLNAGRPRSNVGLLCGVNRHGERTESGGSREEIGVDSHVTLSLVSAYQCAADYRERCS